MPPVRSTPARRPRRLHLPSRDLRFDRAAQKRRGTDDEPREGAPTGDNGKEGRKSQIYPAAATYSRFATVLPAAAPGRRHGPRSAGQRPVPDHGAGRIAAARRGRRCPRKTSMMNVISPRAGPRLYAALDAAAGRTGSASVCLRWTSHALSRTAVHVARGRSRTSQHPPRLSARRIRPPAPGVSPRAREGAGAGSNGIRQYRARPGRRRSRRPGVQRHRPRPLHRARSLHR